MAKLILATTDHQTAAQQHAHAVAALCKQLDTIAAKLEVLLPCDSGRGLAAAIREQADYAAVLAGVPTFKRLPEGIASDAFPPIGGNECRILAEQLAGPEPTIAIEYLRHFVARVAALLDGRERAPSRSAPSRSNADETPLSQRPAVAGFAA